MKKKKVLFVTEASFHPTGYSVYTKEILKRLSKHPELEVAELGCFSGPEAEEIKDIPYTLLRDNEVLHQYLAKNKLKFLIPSKYTWGRQGPPADTSE